MHKKKKKKIINRIGNTTREKGGEYKKEGKKTSKMKRETSCERKREELLAVNLSKLGQIDADSQKGTSSLKTPSSFAAQSNTAKT